MNMWVRQWIPVLRECFSNASHWVRRQIAVLRECFSNVSRLVRQQVLVMRELYANDSPFNKFLLLIGFIFILLSPIRLFVPKEQFDKILGLIFFGSCIVYFLWRDRYPALKWWIAETEHGQNNGKDPSGNKELPPPPPTWRRVFRIFGRIFSYRIFSKWQSLQLFDRLYVLAFIIAGLGLVSLPIYGKPTKFLYGSFLLVYGVSGIGFGIWLWPWLQRIWDWKIGKLAITLLHGGILLLSIIPARLLVAEALGLPPQDFDVTVAFCVLLFYPPLWLIVFEVFTLLFAIIRFIAAALCSFTTYFPINVLVLLIAKLFPAGSGPRLFLERDIGKFVWRGFVHIIGVMGIVFGITLFWQWYSPATRSLKPIVRAVAYFADFQQVSLYPGVDVNRRLRLHENGVVSYAEERGWDIVISVEKVQ
jgi:hypothetical protein